MKILCVGLVLCLSLAAAGALWAADPVAIEVHYQSGVKYFKRGLYDKAIQEFEKTLRMEPQHEEARAYLAQVRELQKAHRPAEARASQDAEVRKLYDEGRRLYRARDYEEAIEVFNKILSIKPIDDFASYYRERSEILLSRKIAREKKQEARRRRPEEKREAQEAARKKKEAAPPAKKEAQGTVTAALDGAESPAASRERKRQEKLQLKEERRQEKLRLKEDKRAQARRRREAKQQAREERRQEKLRLKEDKRARKESHVRAKEEKAAAAQERREQEEARALDKRAANKRLREERRQNKERFLEGVKAYGRKEYKAAITAFKDVIKAEERTGALYTRPANRLIDKSRKRLEGMGKDIAI